jgi:hypothetical protein
MTKVKIIKTMPASQNNNYTKINIVKYRGYTGFKVGNLYLLSLRFFDTINHEKQIYKWYIFTECGQEFLRVNDNVWCLSVIQDDYIEFIFNLDIFKYNKLKYLNLKVKLKEVKK